MENGSSMEYAVIAAKSATSGKRAEEGLEKQNKPIAMPVQQVNTITASSTFAGERPKEESLREVSHEQLRAGTSM